MTSPDDEYSHAKAVNTIFGINGPEWFVDKAQRDLERYMRADDDAVRADALLDLSASLVSVEDWTFSPTSGMSASEWRNHHRDACPAHTLVALIALVSKHRDLNDGRFKQMRLESGGELRFWTDDASPQKTIDWLNSQGPRGYTINNVRTVVDDDQIIGYEIFVTTETLMSDGRMRSVASILEEALRYWSGVVGR